MAAMTVGPPLAAAVPARSAGMREPYAKTPSNSVATTLRATLTSTLRLMARPPSLRRMSST